ncbi:hypothetical protein TWF569_011863 [Orbilia oligospora]|nr:hypothetical protein TWF103_009626 [Orbilia oligospora]KAF3127048.1 hypothetical protein TWF569_011863 [Orbilia oligospora]KAF3141836.1 hypothetical protein TWF594_005894 [Orbilia oligospora]
MRGVGWGVRKWGSGPASTTIWWVVRLRHPSMSGGGVGLRSGAPAHLSMGVGWAGGLRGGAPALLLPPYGGLPTSSPPLHWCGGDVRRWGSGPFSSTKKLPRGWAPARVAIVREEAKGAPILALAHRPWFNYHGPRAIQWRGIWRKPPPQRG